MKNRKREIAVLGEGDTEVNAIHYFVKRHWQQDGLSQVGLRAISLNGKLEDVGYQTTQFRQLGYIAVFTLIDLQGMTRVQHRPDDDLPQKIQRVKQWLLDQVVSSETEFFHPHVSVHEVEAWILADGRCLARGLKDKTIEPDPQAELKNFANPPSRRIDTLFHRNRGERYRKLKDGIPLFQGLTFDTVYNSCRYFREFYDDLKSVGQATLKQLT